MTKISHTLLAALAGITIAAAPVTAQRQSDLQMGIRPVATTDLSTDHLSGVAEIRKTYWKEGASSAP